MTTDTNTAAAAAAAAIAATEDAATATPFHVRDGSGAGSPLVVGRPGVVPYLVRWTGEPDLPMPVVRRGRGGGIGYADEQRYDRDGYQVLWSRVVSRPGRGRPRFGEVHSARQRQCMTAVRCHICGGGADRTDAGVLWIIDARPEDLHPVRELTVHPPVCRPCAHLSLAACPHLQRAVTVVRAREFTLHGVAGVLYTPGPGKPVPMDHGTFPFTHYCAPYLRAYQLVMRLTDYTPIDLNDPTT